MATSSFDGETLDGPRGRGRPDDSPCTPAAHALHYGSACFEGLKAHRQPDGRVVAFRADRHIARLRQSAGRLHLPVPPSDLVETLLDGDDRRQRGRRAVPPGSLYLRPTLLGTDVTIGAAAAPSADGDPVRAGVPGRRLPAAATADDRRRDRHPADHAAVRRRQGRRQLRDGAGADHGGRGALGRRPGAVRAGRSYRGDRRVERPAARRSPRRSPRR